MTDKAFLLDIKQNPHKLGIMLGYKDLTPIHSEWIIKAWTRDEYVLQAHRNSYKTTAVLVVGAIWHLLFNPDDTILIVRKEMTGASSILREISKQYKSAVMQRLYKEIFRHDLELLRDTNESIHLSFKSSITKEGSIEALGIGGAITGRHYKRIIADDVVTLKDRLSRAERRQATLFINELYNIKTIDGGIAITGTPWHKNDAFSMFDEIDRYPIGSLEIAGMTKEKLNEIKKRTTTSLYSANYLLKHVSDEDAEFSDIEFGKYDIKMSGIAQIDCAYGGGHYTAMTLIQRQGEDLVVRGYCWERSITTLYGAIVGIVQNSNISEIYTEKNADKGLASDELKKMGLVMRDYQEKTNKHHKISTHIKNVFERLYFDEDSDDEYISQIADYQYGQEPDDAPDSLASVLMQSGIGDEDLNVIRGSGVAIKRRWSY